MPCTDPSSQKGWEGFVGNDQSSWKGFVGNDQSSSAQDHGWRLQAAANIWPLAELKPLYFKFNFLCFSWFPLPFVLLLSASAGKSLALSWDRNPAALGCESKTTSGFYFIKVK